MNTQGVAVERQYGRPILNSFHACYSLGGLVGALAAGLVASHGIAPLPHFLGVALLCAILVLSAARSLLPAHAEAQRTGVAFARPTRAILALGLVAFCVVLGEGAIADWSAIYLNGTLRTGAGLAAAGYAAFSVVMAVGFWPGWRRVFCGVPPYAERCWPHLQAGCWYGDCSGRDLRICWLSCRATCYWVRRECPEPAHRPRLCRCAEPVCCCIRSCSRR